MPIQVEVVFFLVVILEGLSDFHAVLMAVPETLWATGA